MQELSVQRVEERCAGTSPVRQVLVGSVELIRLDAYTIKRYTGTEEVRCITRSDGWARKHDRHPDQADELVVDRDMSKWCHGAQIGK